MSAGAAHHAAIRMLQSRTSGELLNLFQTLAAPDFSAMKGEFRATLLDQGCPYFGAFNLTVLNNPANGFWLAKAFTPEGPENGHGYNVFFRKGKILRKFRMKTDLAPSRWDGKTSFRLTYRVYNSLCGWVCMEDEVRKLEDGIYLGIGVYGPFRKTPMPFILEGPVAGFKGADKDEKWPFGLFSGKP